MFRARRQGRRTAVVVAGMLLAAIAAVSPAEAILDGVADPANSQANVGAVEYRIQGMWFTQCSGTLIAPDLVLTAAHCAAFPGGGTVPASEVRVNFNPALNIPGDPADAFAYAVDEVLVHPAFLDAALGGGNSKTQLASPWEDIALFKLATAVDGIQPAPVAPVGYLDQFATHAATFTAVGYGVNTFVQGSASVPSWSIRIPEYRSFRNVTILGNDAYPDRWVKISAATCFGDSGGPLLHNGTVVAILSWTNSNRCEGPGLAYRVDSVIAQDFLSENIP